MPTTAPLPNRLPLIETCYRLARRQGYVDLDSVLALFSKTRHQAPSADEIDQALIGLSSQGRLVCDPLQPSAKQSLLRPARSLAKAAVA